LIHNSITNLGNGKETSKCSKGCMETQLCSYCQMRISMCTEQINNVCTTAFLREFLEDTEDNLLNKNKFTMHGFKTTAYNLLHTNICTSRR